MQDLSVADGAYVRPSPSRGSLGGVARNTLDSIILTEASGYDICLVETVGVGQSETMVADMVDMFVLLLQPGSGDELQGVKRGIMELADLIIINKADGALEIPAKLTRTEIMNALHLMLPRRSCWTPKVVRASAVTGFNLERVWSTIETYFEKLRESDEWDSLRSEQQSKWMWREVTNLLMMRINRDPQAKELARSLEKDVISGKLPPGIAAEQIVSRFLSASK
ncbi:ArgK protein [Martensiomyces pterosporus]|nr:ArgK protein [Martensiomyces pterosporus]